VPRVSSALVAPPFAKGNVLKTKRPAQRDDLRAEYNFNYSTATRGKYYRRLIREGANVPHAGWRIHGGFCHVCDHGIRSIASTELSSR
jgi:hypothetical protein